jgi:penicillin-binding protein 1A
MSTQPLPGAGPQSLRQGVWPGLMARWRRLNGWQRSGLGLAALGGAGLLALAALTLWCWRQLPPLDQAIDYRPRQHLQVLTSDGVEIAAFGAERRLFVPVAEMPKVLRDAVLSVEDADFYRHGAISLRGVARAMVADLSGGMTQGASTITQQVARTFFLSTRRTAERKIKEALLAIQLEHRLDKDQILELYLNQIFLGERAYGFGAAAQVYFGKPLADLSIAEAAMLAGLPQNPIHANPIANPRLARRRQHWVLLRMRKTGAISAAQYTQAIAEKLVIKSPLFVDVNAQHVAEMAREDVVARLGDKAYTEGIRVVTSLRASDQRAAQAALRRAVLAHGRSQPWRGPEDQVSLPDDPAQADRSAAQALADERDDAELRVAVVMQASPKAIVAKLATGETVTVAGSSLGWVQAALSPKAPAALAIRRGAIVRLMALPQGKGPGQGPAQTWTLVQWPQVEAAFVALDPQTGRVRALVGGFDFNHSQFNHVTRAQRQPGSSFKPFLYSAAFESGVMPETQVSDAPLPPDIGGPSGWDPHDDDGSESGYLSVRQGLAQSKNLVSIRLLEHLGLQPARDWIARFGFDMAQQPDDLTLALGTGSVTPMKLALAYAVFANGGHRIAPVLIERITTAQGDLLYQAPAPAALDESNRVLPARNVFLVNSLLADVTRSGTAASAQQLLPRPDLYGKTGTTNDAVDAWFAGFAPGAVAVAWMGYDEPRSLGAGQTGAKLALPIWIDAMTEMLRGVPVQPLSVYRPPQGIVDVGSDFRYSEFANDGAVLSIDDASLAAEAARASAASAPASSAASSGAAASAPLAGAAPG